ncbi:MAG: RNA-binding protein [Flavobacteriales bacterium]|nr:RNA-binding protein [Flavobacteriales bacterium]
MTIYVGNIPYSMTEEDLQKIFGEHGAVQSAKIIVNKFNGRSKGFGFVDMDNASVEETAVSELDGKDIDGRNLRVIIAHPRDEGPDGNRA